MIDKIKELIEQTDLTNQEISVLIDLLKTKIKTDKNYFEITVNSNSYKGTGKCWIQEIIEGKREGFVDPYNVDKSDRYRLEKTFRLQPGEYLINTSGSKSQDHRYKLRVKEDFTTEEFK